MTGTTQPTAGTVMHRQPPTADQDTSLWASWGRLRGDDCRHLVVVDSALRPVAVLEERDLALRWPPGPSEAHRVALRQVVRGPAPSCARSDDDAATVARAMLAAQTDAVPVVDDDGRLIGLVTARHYVELVARGELSAPVPAARRGHATSATDRTGRVPAAPRP